MYIMLVSRPVGGGGMLLQAHPLHSRSWINGRNDRKGPKTEDLPTGCSSVQCFENHETPKYASIWL